MKIIPMFLMLGLIGLSFSLSAQFKVAGNGNIGINTSSPAFKLDINSPDSRFFYSTGNALHINHYGLDPRLCSNEKIVFFKTNGTGYANIECRVLLQHLGNPSNDNIESLENKGLPTITKLKGISFKTINDSTLGKEFGFLAQDVEAVIPEAVFKNDSTNEKSLAYSFIVAFLVEAVKEQNVMIGDLKIKVTSLEKDLQEKGLITTSPFRISGESNYAKARLDQNIPNPFSKETKIGCFIPEDTNSSFLYNYTINGIPIRKYPIQGKDKQILTIDGTNLAPGIYLYKLIVDGKEIDTKRMILAK